MLARRIRLDQRLNLTEFPTDGASGLSKEEAKQRLEDLGKEVGELQELLFAAGDHGLLVVFQGMDTAGKDGAINRFLEYVNVQSCRVSSFKVPTPLELAHDFLWRVHAVAPPKGSIGVFNRSHYEDVLVVRVKSLVPENVWRLRYEQINAFESLLAASGTIIVKFFLHISKNEQEQRLLEREQDVQKAWKLSVGDWREREHWDAYQQAYEEALSRCSTDEAPWYVIPADKKWARDLAVAEVLAETLRPYRDTWIGQLASVGDRAKAELLAYRAELAQSAQATR